MTGFIIRHAQATDEAQWRIMWGLYTRPYPSPVVTEEVTAGTWVRILDTANPLHCLVAEFDGTLLGFIHYVIHPRAWSLRDACYMEDLYVVEPVRRKGIGRQLCLHLRGVCIEKKISRIYWHTEANNVAQKLYDQVGTKDDFIRYMVLLP